MKKEINHLLESENASLKVNNYCTLHRWTKDILNNDVDRLVATFSITHYSSHSYEIKARDWQGIVAEVQESQTKAFTASADELNKQLANGYIG